VGKGWGRSRPNRNGDRHGDRSGPDKDAGIDTEMGVVRTKTRGQARRWERSAQDAGIYTRIGVVLAKTRGQTRGWECSGPRRWDVSDQGPDVLWTQARRQTWGWELSGPGPRNGDRCGNEICPGQDANIDTEMGEVRAKTRRQIWGWEWSGPNKNGDKEGDGSCADQDVGIDPGMGVVRARKQRQTRGYKKSGPSTRMLVEWSGPRRGERHGDGNGHDPTNMETDTDIILSQPEHGDGLNGW
jgi:hypothetical protein